jgi:hypothetical protein
MKPLNSELHEEVRVAVHSHWPSEPHWRFIDVRRALNVKPYKLYAYDWPVKRAARQILRIENRGLYSAYTGIGT